LSRTTPLLKATAALGAAIAGSLVFVTASFATYNGPASFENYSGNGSCRELGYAHSVRIEARDEYPASGTYSDGPLTVTLTVNPNSPITFAFSANQLVETVLVKTGPGGYRYTYTPGVASDSGLESPKSDAISHLEFCYGRPTAVRLQSLVAKRTAGGVVVTWRAAASADMLGYNLYREQGGKRVRLNASLIAAAPGARAKLYRWFDRHATGASVRYWLQGVSATGARTWHRATTTS
jgi:hypothetical protein